MDARPTPRSSRRPRPQGVPIAAPWLSALQRRRWQTLQGATGAATGRCGSFSSCSCFSLFAEFIANDKPMMVKYDGHYYFPIFKSYPETAFGGVFETEADYRDPAVKG